ncbi:MAG: hypothetical protein ACF8AM_19915 [Rhodopirellula sp. JB055]|uniref:hypothetical protein n=1 Tax=Rhodopirellula sp. JB055 TaxID=3342846 RepID=UPI00370BDB43
MPATTRYEPVPTITYLGEQSSQCDPKLVSRYDELTRRRKMNWTGHYNLRRMLGRGGQGEVYLTEHRGTDGFTVPVAMKIFSPERFPDARSYDDAMQRIASIAARIALIQHDNLLDVQNFFERDRIRVRYQNHCRPRTTRTLPETERCCGRNDHGLNVFYHRDTESKTTAQ